MKNDLICKFWEWLQLVWITLIEFGACNGLATVEKITTQIVIWTWTSYKCLMLICYDVCYSIHIPSWMDYIRPEWEDKSFTFNYSLWQLIFSCNERKNSKALAGILFFFNKSFTFSFRYFFIYLKFYLFLLDILWKICFFLDTLI